MNYEQPAQLTDDNVSVDDYYTRLDTNDWHFLNLEVLKFQSRKLLDQNRKM